ncbi:hypothetical protein KIN20_007521 [Parelaphostrongylus tenuis]|uniref:Uncharacterized protein n=1 Tax=Parelaphostrongylus tenuis TaxID=148309 RepID=A0AAD5MMC7_PARTN|nr:hypothetical protein KIN20_007521 [Parelaphostrongylus tenuis]
MPSAADTQTTTDASGTQEIPAAVDGDTALSVLSSTTSSESVVPNTEMTDLSGEIEENDLGVQENEDQLTQMLLLKIDKPELDIVKVNTWPIYTIRGKPPLTLPI